ncbi:hypothetical protein [Methylobacterium radiotolerans]|nr:hypothetical protein [Methylobacterium radiotolerans]
MVCVALFCGASLIVVAVLAIVLQAEIGVPALEWDDAEKAANI